MDKLALAMGISILLVLERIPSLQIVRAPLWRPHLLSDLACLATGATALGLVMRQAAIALGAGLPSAGPLLDDLPRVAVLAVAVIAYDLGSYLTHRLLHASDVLWRLHAVHHSSRSLDWLATFRAHVLEHALRHLTSPVVLLLVGFPPEAVAAAAGIHVAFAMLNHANLRCGATVFEAVLVTPRLHRLHHVSESCARNFGTVFSVWDRLCGTLLLDRDAPLAPLGVPGQEASYPEGWLAQLREPFRRRTRSSATREPSYKQA